MKGIGLPGGIGWRRIDRAEWRVAITLQNLDGADRHAYERPERGIADQPHYHDRRPPNG